MDRRGHEDGALVTAPTRGGELLLELGPRYTRLNADARTIHVADRFITLIDRHRRRERRDAHLLFGGLWMARDVPYGDLGLWEELEPGAVRRVFGVEPQSLFDSDGLDALRALDRLAVRLRPALNPFAKGAVRALELGRGLDKVLVLDFGNRAELFMRRLFRDRARRILEVRADGTIVIPQRRGTQVVTCRSHFGVTVLGDYLRFSDPSGTDLGRVALPWVAQQDREELARRMGRLIDPTY